MWVSAMMRRMEETGGRAEPADSLIRVPIGLHPLLAVRVPKSQHDHVLRTLGLGIVNGEFPQNSLLPGDADLLKRLGVSRTVLREALKTLSAKGMVLAKAKTGTRVRERRFWNLFDSDVLYWHLESGVDSRFLFHLSEMRLVFEPEAAALAALRRTDAHLAELARWADVMEASRSAPSDFVEGDLQLHLAIAEASGNPMMRSIGALIEVALAMTFAISSPIPNSERHAEAVANHRAVVDAIAARDPDAARAAMRVVIRLGLDRATASGRLGVDTPR